MDTYIKHHKKPHAKYLNVDGFNKVYNTSIGVSKDFDSQFFKLYSKERKRSGPDEFIMASLNVNHVNDDVLGMKEPTARIEKVEPQKVDLEQDDVLGMESVNVMQGEVSLEDALQEDSTVQEKIEEIVLERAKDATSAQLDLKNIVHFNNGTNVRDRIMKGTKQNIKSLQDYLDGYTDTTVRLSYKKNNKSVKISDLKPDLDSLKEFLNDSKNIREVKCSV
jgi:hypothetical protein